MEASKVQQPHIAKTCQNCNRGHYVLPKNGQQWHLNCSDCGATLFCYVPMEHQADFHQHLAKFRLYAGGYGSAKTSTCSAEIIDHIINTPLGMTLIGAATFPQLEETAKKTFFEMFPADFIKDWSEKHQRIKTINGHTVVFRPLDKEGKARSLNLTGFWIEEASEVEYEYFTQLRTRLRSIATDHHIGILSSNPDLGWIKDEFLMKSTEIHGGDVDYRVPEENKNTNYVTFIASTRQNKHLPPNYYDDTAEGMPDWWIRRYLEGSFENREGLVYPNLGNCYVPRFDIPKNWERIMAADFGIADPTAILWGAIDPDRNKLILYKEHYVANKPISYHAKIINAHNHSLVPSTLRPLIGDPSGNQRNKKDLNSIFDSYAEHDVFFSPGNNKIEDGVQRVYNLVEGGHVEIFDDLTWFRYEAERYKYPPKKLGEEKNLDKPMDKYNHLMDTFRYLVMDLPLDFSELKGNSHIDGLSKKYHKKAVDQSYLPHALQDEEEEDHSDWLAYY